MGKAFGENTIKMVYSQITSNKRKSILLFCLFFIFIMVIATIFSKLAGIGTYFGAFLGFIFSLISALYSYYLGDKVVLKISKAREISKKESPILFNIIESLTLGTGLPMPRIYIMEDNSINAFATGRDPEHASIAVTTGALNRLNKEELEGVLAHEVSHIKNFDIRIMVLTSVLVGTIVMLSDLFLRGFLFTKSDRDEKGNINIIIIIIGFTLALLSPVFANLIKLAISRRREYLADMSGALLTKNPGGLANALKKISGDNNTLRTANHATAPLFISNPFKNKKSWFESLLSTHPPLKDRIKKLEQL